MNVQRGWQLRCRRGRGRHGCRMLWGRMRLMRLLLQSVGNQIHGRTETNRATQRSPHAAKLDAGEAFFHRR